MTPDEAIGLAIKRARLAQGLSQEAIGASQSFVSDVERGKKSVTVQRLEEFANVLGISPATLVVKAELIAFPEITLDQLLDKLRSQVADIS